MNRLIETSSSQRGGAWEAGKRLNLAREMLRNTEWGAWGRFCKIHCPDISSMTIWRYRTIGSFYNTLLEFDGMTLSEMYHQMKLAKFKKEGEYAGAVAAKHEDDPYTVKLFKALAKLSSKFDEPEKLTSDDTDLMVKASRKLVLVMQSQQPVIEVDSEEVET